MANSHWDAPAARCWSQILRRNVFVCFFNSACVRHGCSRRCYGLMWFMLVTSSATCAVSPITRTCPATCAIFIRYQVWPTPSICGTSRGTTTRAIALSTRPASPPRGPSSTSLFHMGAVDRSGRWRLLAQVQKPRRERYLTPPRLPAQTLLCGLRRLGYQKSCRDMGEISHILGPAISNPDSLRVLGDERPSQPTTRSARIVRVPLGDGTSCSAYLARPSRFAIGRRGASVLRTLA